MRTDEALKEFNKCFNQLAYRHSPHEVFSDFLDFSLWMLNINKNEKAFEEVKGLNTKYKETEAQTMATMFNSWADASDNNGEGFYDALGDLFMEFLSFGKNGQFFTPQPICDMMANFHSMDTTCTEPKTVCDPSCGSGRMLLAAAKINRHNKFYGADVDLVCCKMAALNLIINSMQGEIAWMNTISMEHYKSWHIKTILDSSNHYIPYYYTTGKGETTFINKLKMKVEKPLPDHRFKGPVKEGTQFILF